LCGWSPAKTPMRVIEVELKQRGLSHAVYVYTVS